MTGSFNALNKEYTKLWKKKLPGDELKRTYFDAINDELQKPIKCLGDFLK